MNNLQVFSNSEFGDVRTIEESGKILFCGSDVAKILGYAIPSKAVNSHCKGVSKTEVPTKGGNQLMLFITEGDVYRLITNSKLPSAEKFEAWVFDEVLPTIRKHGAYLTPEKIEEVLLNPDTIIKLATEIKALQSENAVQKQLIAEFKPIKEYVDTILSCEDAVTTTQVAADYGISATALNRILNKQGIIRKVGGQWILYNAHMGKGYTKSETIDVLRADGSVKVVMNTKWTQKGRLKIHELLTATGIKANMDKSA